MSEKVRTVMPTISKVDRPMLIVTKKLTFHQNYGAYMLQGDFPFNERKSYKEWAERLISNEI